MKCDNVEGLMICKNIEEVVDYVKENKKHIESSYVIGGGSIYKQFLEKNLISDIYATEIDSQYVCDTFFPKVSNFIEKKKIRHFHSTKELNRNERV